MKICYLLIKKYKNLKEIGISFDSHYLYEYDKDKAEVVVKDNPSYLSGFYGEHIYSLTTIAGKNGVGKTNILRFLLTAVVEGMNDKSDCQGVVIYKDGDRLLLASNGLEIQSVYNDHQLEKVNHKSCHTFFYTSHPIYSIRNWDILTQELTGQYNASASTRLLLDQGNYVNDGKSAKGTLSYYDYLLAHLSQRSFKILQFLIDYYRNGRELNGLTIPPYILILANSSGFYKFIKKEFGITNDRAYNNKIRNWNHIRNATLYDFFITSLLNKASNKNEYDAWQPLIDSWEKKVKQSQDDDVVKLWQEWMQGKPYEEELQRILTVVTTINEKCGFNDKSGFFYFNLRGNLDEVAEFVQSIYNTREFLAARYFDVSFSYDASSDAMLSSGEEKLLYLMAEIYYSHILRPKKFDNVDAPSLYVLDEAELGLHPEWQRAFVSYLLAFFNYFPSKNIQIVLTTHSPILLSDILRQDIVLLKKEKGETIVEKQHKETFATNIFELYRDSFFLENGLLGIFAGGKIKGIVDDIESRSHLDTLAKRISMIGDPQIKNYLTMKFAAIDQLQAISLLEEQINQIRRGEIWK